jgi:hypothetical protein
MADSVTPPSPAPQPVPKRHGIWVQVVLQALALIFVVGALNVISGRRYIRWDLSESESHTLSGSTLNYLRRLARDVDITVLLPRASRLHGEMRSLTEEYRRNGKERVNVTYVDPQLDLDVAEKLKLDYGLRLDQSGVLVRTGGRQKFVREDELVVLGPGIDKDHPTIDFRGEDALTTAMVSLIDVAPRKIYVLVGKGSDAQTRLEQQLKALAEIGKQVSYECAALDLAVEQAVPADATGLVLAGVRYDLTDTELLALENYWGTKRASLLVLLDAAAETPKLDAFLKRSGVLPRGDRVLSARSTGLGPKIEFTVQGHFSADSVITRHLTAATGTFTSQTESLELQEKDEALKAAGTELKRLMIADDRFWGETTYSELGGGDKLPVADGTDARAPVTIAASVERGALQDERMRVESARLVVVGNASLMDKETRLAVNQDFLGAALTWMTGRERLIGILPKRKQQYRLQLSDRERELVFWMTAWVSPAVVLMAGLLIWTQRRAS